MVLSLLEFIIFIFLIIPKTLRAQWTLQLRRNITFNASSLLPTIPLNPLHTLYLIWYEIIQFPYSILISVLDQISPFHKHGISTSHTHTPTKCLSRATTASIPLIITIRPINILRLLILKISTAYIIVIIPLSSAPWLLGSQNS